VSEKDIEKAIKNATVSIEMEGLSVDEQSKALCRKLLLNEITFEQYLTIVKQKAGVNV
jgi:hypothetical protein